MNTTSKKFIEITCAKEKILINVNEIELIERDARKIHIITKGEDYSVYESLDSILKRLPENFVRCHTGYIVNLDYTTSIHSNYLIMKDDRKITIGRTYKDLLMNL